MLMITQGPTQDIENDSLEIRLPGLKQRDRVAHDLVRRFRLFVRLFIRLFVRLSVRLSVRLFVQLVVQFCVADSQWLSKGGRELAASRLLPRAEAALRQELQRLADAAKRAREGQSSSSSVWRAL
jgi:hypothetical protein